MPTRSAPEPTSAPPQRGRGRFAPSPTGPLHFGSLLAAFGSWLLARHAGAEWWVRVEDLDPPREQSGAIDRQLRTLEAFGLVSDGPILRQSSRDAAYRTALDRLLAEGAAFECWCSRADLLATGSVHHACLSGPTEGRTPAIRLRIPRGAIIGFDDAIQGRIVQDVGTEVGDVVLRRADGYWAYQLAVVVDDAAQGITQVVRGADLLDSTPRQVFLQRALGLPTPDYAHLPLVVDHEGRKLSKSLSALPIDDADPLPALRAAWRAMGQDPAALAQVADVPSALDAARAAFVPDWIPSGSVALHNTGVAIAP
ncbi:tRNA glutamyl-Q(34) synthetase GluQRS [Lysobacter sp. A6]|uniref:Glutamyl-Q tRNA(Asp) synthetase n=1 Tax=Noviluteimonas lactosilytica TaxID=2888523 RepID=A0ABS8JEI5_9GAMM|nr:tRNA glutamyl-Q(34) synthetase GluQRS [Lysobacter lactosilyticus]MCC8361988.1 tRNA glutamyl-Q(34) synthetase GluQRS [Lysobacter lactosilyticus]